MSFAFRIMIVAVMLTAGAAVVDLRAQEPTYAQVSVTGCLQRAGEQFVIVVAESEQHEVQAAPSVGLAAHVNHRVELTGTVEKKGDAMIFKAAALKMIANSCAP